MFGTRLALGLGMSNATTNQGVQTMELAEYLAEQSKEICAMNECTDAEHNCGSYAYITKDGDLLDVCYPDYFQGSAEPHAAIMLPWTGTQEELEAEIEEQTWGEE